MGAANLRRSLSPLHAEVEALLWAMKCMIGADHQEVAFLTDCSDLVKMVSSPTEWPAFSVFGSKFLTSDHPFSLSLLDSSISGCAFTLYQVVLCLSQVHPSLEVYPESEPRSSAADSKKSLLMAIKVQIYDVSKSRERGDLKKVEMTTRSG
ncbi:Ribonuclease H domain [Arabidopsis suecica]|uniref:Ribonuclease H domain n=1 Tax=Arabidopsis suecica TaxID=45249 RepID=A0A8T2BDZ4_ARASU|nr:Ribonuclease H domain [Arabidopsis suecica]